MNNGKGKWQPADGDNTMITQITQWDDKHTDEYGREDQRQVPRNAEMVRADRIVEIKMQKLKK